MHDKLFSNQGKERGPLPLVVGVTGHRDLREEDHAALEGQVAEIFKDLSKRYPHTPLLLLSALAEGADRLVARVALRTGARLVAPLPLPRAEYERDFATAASREEFAALLTQAEEWFELPLAKGSTLENTRKSGKNRDLQYAQVGAYVVQYSQILIALWDGADTRGVGGTAEVVEFMQAGLPKDSGGLFHLPEPHPLDPVENGPVYHIVTPHLKNPRPEGTPFRSSTLFPKSYKSEHAAQAAFDRIQQRMEGFNRDVLRLASSLAGKISTNKGYLFPDSEAEDLSEPLQSLRNHYGMADTLANHFQKWTYGTLAGLFLLVFVAIVIFGFYAHLAVPPVHLSFLGLYLSVFAFAIAWFHWANWRDFQNKHQDYRALAEGLRVQFFWRLAGLHSSVADYYLRRQKSEIDWIRDSIRTWSVRVSPESGDRLQQVLVHWVKDQRDYFRRSSHRDAVRSTYLVEVGAGFLLISLGMAAWEISFGLPLHADGSMAAPDIFKIIAAILVILVLYEIVHKLREAVKEEGPRQVLMNLVPLVLGFSGGLLFLAFFWAAPHMLPSNIASYFKQHQQEWWIVAMVVTAAIPALLHAYAEQRALSEHEKQYQHMESLFGRAEQHLERLGNTLDAGNASALLLELGKDALAEQGDWVLLHRERPIEPPRAEL